MLKMLAKQKQGGEDNRARTGRENKSASRPAKVTRIKDALSTTLSTNPSTNRAKLRYSKDSSQKNERSAGFVGTAAGVKRKRAFASDSRLPNKALKPYNNRLRTKYDANRSHQVQKQSPAPSIDFTYDGLSEPYASLFKMALAVDLGLMSVHSRHEYCSIDQVRTAVETSCQRSFTERDFAKVAFLFPGAYAWKYLRSHSAKIRGETRNTLHIRMNRRHAKETIKEVSSNVGGKMLSDRRRELYEIIKRAQTQRIEVVPILLEKMQERIISNNSKDMLIPSSRLNKAHRVGRLKFSGMLILKLCFRKTLAEI